MSTVSLLYCKAGECPLVLENPPPAYPPPLRKKATALLQFLPDLKHNFRFLILAADRLNWCCLLFSSSSILLYLPRWKSVVVIIVVVASFELSLFLTAVALLTPISTEKMRLYTFPPFYPPKKYYVDTHCGWCRWAKYFLEMATILLKKHFIFLMFYWLSLFIGCLSTLLVCLCNHK